jgi:RND family efflux transporter MFP subunit
MNRPTTWYLRLLTVLIILIAGVLLSNSCSLSRSQEEEATPTPIPTSIVPEKPTYTVKSGEVVEKLEFAGRVSPVVQERLFFATPGRVGEVFVKGDEWVETGDLLAELEVTDLKDQLAQAEAALEAALSQHEEQLANAEADLHAAELNLAITQASDPGPQIAVSEAALQKAQAALENAQAGAGDVQDAEYDLTVAEADYQRALQSRQVYSYTVQLREQDVDMADMRLQRLETGIDVEELKLAVQRLNGQLEDARLIAPFDGQILAVAIRKGQEVEAFEPAMVLVDPSELEVSAELPDSQLERLVEGMPVSVAPTTQTGEEMQGTIRLLPYPFGSGAEGDTAEGILSTRVTVESLAQADESEIGDAMDVVVVLERKPDVLWLPQQAIRNFEGRRFVVVQNEAGQVRKDIKIGIEGEGRVEVEEGLTEGEIVIGQ